MSIYEFNPRFGRTPLVPRARQLPWWSRRLMKLSTLI